MSAVPRLRTPRPTRWSRLRPEDVGDAVERLTTWPCEVGGATRYMFALAALERFGADVARVARRGTAWSCCVVLPGKVVVPCGDPDVLVSARSPVRRWRLVVSDAAAVDAMIGAADRDPGVRVHHQRLLQVDPERVPDVTSLPDPGLRRATLVDLDALAALAVDLHVDDGFGPDPGPSGLRGYAARIEESIKRGVVWCVGPHGRPVAKVERSVSSDRYGVQLSGIVVSRGVRGQHLGRAAVAAAVRAALAEGEEGRIVSLHVRAANTPALRAYEAAGFVDREEWRLAVRP